VSGFVSAPTFGAGVNFKGKRVDFMRISLARPVTAAATLAALALPALALDGPPVLDQVAGHRRNGRRMVVPALAIWRQGLSAEVKLHR
jgi:hypothetical protein